MWKVCLALAAFINYGNAKLGCKNMNGEDVDWFVINDTVYGHSFCIDLLHRFAAIKLPPGIDERKGKSFVYFDSTQDGWQMSPEGIDSNKSAIGATISQIYDMDQENTFTIAYNDDSPVKAVYSNRGHSKGVAAFDSDVGFWMVHSIPNFPPLTMVPGVTMSTYESIKLKVTSTIVVVIRALKKYDYPKSGSRFAQSILCLSLSTNALEDIGQYMRFAQVTPFLTNLPDSFKVV
ncbi:deoxyribonuclease II [Ancylostoma duodenale]|uniref:Deoxyribonuclease II n=1 Tax=Ancylostoma duodenale TaxID=51022 RepID=A0A0C2GJV2_9BILA|nr:deoxyribonuclease II [Ancylostoma duodenale]